MAMAVAVAVAVAVAEAEAEDAYRSSLPPPLLAQDSQAIPLRANASQSRADLGGPRSQAETCRL